MRHRTTVFDLSVVGLLAMFLPGVAFGSDRGENFVRNPGAEDAHDGLPSEWYGAYRAAKGLRLWRAVDERYSGAACLAIHSERQVSGPVSNNWAQRIDAIPAGVTVRVSAYIKTEDADEANVCLQGWNKEGGNGQLIAFATTPPIRGDTDWTFAQSRAIVLPPQTAALVVRAALTGQGTAWFDEVTVEVTEGTQGNTGKQKGEATSKTGGATVDADLAKAVSGRIVQTLPIEKDCLVISYLPDWGHGNVDNIAVFNYGGGCRTLLQWRDLSSDVLTAANRQVLLALYARQVPANGPRGPIQLFEITSDWPELTSWKTMPNYADEPAGSTQFSSGEGWKLFDVTNLVREQNKAKRKGNGVLLRFGNEDHQNESGCGYAFVSREGMGEWSARRPVLLVVESK